MAVTGAIADAARSVLPVTWDALAGDSRYGDGFLARKVELVKENVFGEVIPEAQEDDHPLIVQDYCGKLVALTLIPAGIDFWMNAEITVTTTGTQEVAAYVDRAATLRQLGQDLLVETRKLQPDIEEILGFHRQRATRRPLISTLDEDFLTPDPLEFPRPYARTGRS